MCDEKSRAWRELDLDALSHNIMPGPSRLRWLPAAG